MGAFVRAGQAALGTLSTDGIGSHRAAARTLGDAIAAAAAAQAHSAPTLPPRTRRADGQGVDPCARAPPAIRGGERRSPWRSAPTSAFFGPSHVARARASRVARLRAAPRAARHERGDAVVRGARRWTERSSWPRSRRRRCATSRPRATLAAGGAPTPDAGAAPARSARPARRPPGAPPRSALDAVCARSAEATRAPRRACSRTRASHGCASRCSWSSSARRPAAEQTRAQLQRRHSARTWRRARARDARRVLAATCRRVASAHASDGRPSCGRRAAARAFARPRRSTSSGCAAVDDGVVDARTARASCAAPSRPRRALRRPRPSIVSPRSMTRRCIGVARRSTRARCARRDRCASRAASRGASPRGSRRDVRSASSSTDAAAPCGAAPMLLGAACSRAQPRASQRRVDGALRLGARASRASAAHATAPRSAEARKPKHGGAPKRSSPTRRRGAAARRRAEPTAARAAARACMHRRRQDPAVARCGRRCRRRTTWPAPTRRCPSRVVGRAFARRTGGRVVRAQALQTRVVLAHIGMNKPLGRADDRRRRRPMPRLRHKRGASDSRRSANKSLATPRR